MRSGLVAATFATVEAYVFAPGSMASSPAIRTPAVVRSSFILASAALVYAWVESKMIATDFAPSHFEIASVATGAICEVIGWRVKPIPAVSSDDVSRLGTRPALMYHGSVFSPAPELYGPT